MKSPEISTVLVTGGGGYVGSALVPKLLNAGYRVRVLDVFWYGEEVLDGVKDNPNLEIIRGDLRDKALIHAALEGCDAVIHLACVSNDPSFELAPDTGKQINFDAFVPLVDSSIERGVRRFIYASSSSVYGVREENNVTEDLELRPLTDYSKYKAMCEEVLLGKEAPGFTRLIVRPATVCGYAPRLRLDLTVNILTNLAINNKKITVFGGEQMRPNIHIEDMCRFYLEALTWPAAEIDGKIYNVGYENFKVSEIATMVKNSVGQDIEIITTPTDDNRSYHVSSEKVASERGFKASHSLEDAIVDLRNAFQQGLISDPMNDDRYYNIRRMKKIFSSEQATDN